MRGEVHILVYCPIDTLQWGSTHSAVVVQFDSDAVIFISNDFEEAVNGFCTENVYSPLDTGQPLSM